MTNVIKKENGRQPANFGTVIDQIFQNNLSRFFDEPYWGSNSNGYSVPVNIRETATSYEMEIVAPGLQKQDFQLNLAGNMLTVSFESNQEKTAENKQEEWIRREFRRQSFSRSFTLDETVAADKINARYDNGILYLSLPKNEKAVALSRTINVE